MKKGGFSFKLLFITYVYVCVCVSFPPFSFPPFRFAESWSVDGPPSQIR